MRKIYTLLAALLLIGATDASAALSVTVKWNVPGSLKIYVGGTSDGNLAAIPDGATEFVASVNNSWGTTYLAKAPGYEFESVTADGTELSPMYNGMYSIDMSKYNGKEVVVSMEELVYDKTLSVNVINGRDALTATMWGSGREISFVTGEQQIAYSSKFEKGIDIQAPVEGSEDPYIKQNGVEQEWQAYYSWDNFLYHNYQGGNTKGFGFDEGTDFEIKYCNTPDAAEAQIAVITLDMQNDLASKALTFIFNVTQMKAINEHDSFEAKVGDEIRLVFNTKDYSVSVDGTAVEPQGETTPYLFTVEGDKTIELSAETRSYGNVNLTFAVTDLQGVVLRRGSLGGDIVSADQLTNKGTKNYSYKDANENTKSATLTIYETWVSEKSPKIFISEAEGYWLEACEYVDGSDVITTGIATPEFETNIVARKIVKDTKVVVYVSVDGLNADADDVVLRDRNRNTYELEAGYNELLLDAAYCTPLTVSAYALETGTSFSVYNNMEKVSKDEDSNAYPCKLTGEAAIHIFAGRPAPSQYTITAEISTEAQNAEVIVDRLHRLDGDNKSHKTFKNCEVAVTPGNNSYLLDGSAVDFEGTTHTFKATGDHLIQIVKSTSGLELNADTENAPIEFYNLQGQKINTPFPGQMIIVKQGNKATKQIF